MDAQSIDRLRDEFRAELATVRTERDLQAVRDRYVGRKSGAVTALLKSVAAAPAADRPALGRLVNELKSLVEADLEAHHSRLAASRPPADAVDVTLPGRDLVLGHRHPLTIVRDQMEAIFTSMGFAIVEGPEVEDEFHCFDALNMPASHPARDMQDTLYLSEPLAGEAWTPGGPRSEEERRKDVRTLLRTHTSSIQIRYMQQHHPPIRIVAPGRVFRRDNLDLTHTPMFHQVEGLVVGENISLADLKGTLTIFLRRLFGADLPVRFRPSFFPYTEPSAEVDVGCLRCKGEGCAICKQSGWLEILGSGMVHPAVFEAVGYDPERYTGFAWGMGIERVAMVRYRLEDIRMFYENDLRFLEQLPL
jgi:phenylalanyl-tRNA synthetase alpha chain